MKQCLQNGRSPRRRRGFMILLAMVCLAISLVSFAGIFVALRDQADEAAQRRKQIQAVWLADSALERAAARLRIDAAYFGETWRIEAKDIDGRDPATTTIRVSPIADAPHRRRLQVTADFPADSEFRVRESRDVVVELVPAP